MKQFALVNENNWNEYDTIEEAKAARTSNTQLIYDNIKGEFVK